MNEYIYVNKYQVVEVILKHQSYFDSKYLQQSYILPTPLSLALSRKGRHCTKQDSLHQPIVDFECFHEY